MKSLPLKFSQPVCLVGGGALTRDMLDQGRALAPVLVAADGAADRLAALGLMPDAVIGDMDSLSDPARWRDQTTVVEIAEQDSTDFGKCLYATDTPFYIATGFTGRRVDHMLAVFSTMLAHPHKPVILLGEAEVSALVPPKKTLTFEMEVGTVVSIYPLAPVTGTVSEGLRWSVEGLRLQAGQQVGTSNEASATRVSLAFDRPGALLMLERDYLAALVRALTQ